MLVPALVLAQQPISAGGDLRLEILDGEDGVNIIKKKTAVKPVVLVKDKNNLPIAGVPVIIGLGLAGVFDGGGHEATVVTNANGIATAPSFHATTTGQLQISVRASYQGQTATATIRQTNFKTVADALKAGKQPGSSQSGTQAGNGGSSAGQMASSAVASSGGHGALIAVAAVGVAGAGAAGAYEAGLFGKTSTTTISADSCSQSVVNSLISALNSYSSACTNSGAACASAASNFANAMGGFCAACGVNNLSQYLGTSVSSYTSAFQAEGASSSSISNLGGNCR
jgi:hypothetical protein